MSNDKLEMDRIQMALGRLLRRIRTERTTLTIGQLGQKIHYSIGTISKIERGQYDGPPTVEYIEEFISTMKHLKEEEITAFLDVSEVLKEAEEKELWKLMYRLRPRQKTIEGKLRKLGRVKPLESIAKINGLVPDTNSFVGREEELQDLEKYLVIDGCRLVALLGMGGIGKTFLAAKLVEQIKYKFDYVIWCSLRNAPPITEVLTDCIKCFSDRQQTDLPKDVDRLISILIEYLQQQRCLVVFDSTEKILEARGQAGDYLEGYDDYGQLLNILGKTRHQSCLVLTSREKPRGFELLERTSAPVQSLTLIGLGQNDIRDLLKDKELFGDDDAWEGLRESYVGNPLVLCVISANIKDYYGGNIAAFLLEEESGVRIPIRRILDEQFDRLSMLENEIMYWLAIERECVSLSELRENLVQRIESVELMEAIDSLNGRTLVEASEGRFALQDVINEYVTDRLIEQVPEEIIEQKPTLLQSHALIKAQAKTHVREGQVRLILKPVAERLVTLYREKELEDRLNSLLTTSREKSPLEQGYLGGNIINLLCHLGWDLRSYDFSNLTIWQAYLQEMDLHEVDFSYADLTNSIFSETFGGILSVMFSPSGELLAGGTTNGEIRLWRTADSKELLRLEGHSDWTWSVAFSPDGHTLVSGSGDGTVRLWKVDTGQCFHVLRDHTDRVWSVAFGPDGHTIASGGGDGTVRLWEVSTGECVKELREHENQVRSVAFSPDGDKLASGSDDGTVRLWEINTGRCIETLRGHTDRVWSVAFSPDGGKLASGSGDKTVRIWDVSTRQCVKTLPRPKGWVRSVAFSPDGHTLVCGGYDRIAWIWKVDTGEIVKTLEGHAAQIWSVAFHADGDKLASGSGDQTLRIWDIESGKCVKTLKGYTDQIRSIALSPDGHTLISCSEDQSGIRLWDIDTGQYLRTLRDHTERAWAVAFSPDGRTFASGSADRTVRLWKVESGRCVKTLKGHEGWVRSVDFSPDGRTLITGGGDQTVRVWDISTGQCVKTLDEHTKQVRSVAFGPDSHTIASGSGDRTVRVWDISTGKCTRVLKGHEGRVRSIDFSPDGRTLISGSGDQTVRVWDVSTGKCVRILKGHHGWVRSVASNPNGHSIASGSADMTVRIWDISTGQCLNVLAGHTGHVRSVAFSPDGQTLFSSSDDETIRLWDVQTGECFKILRAIRPYERLNITGAKGLTEAQKTTLKALGAVDNG